MTPCDRHAAEKNCKLRGDVEIIKRALLCRRTRRQQQRAHTDAARLADTMCRLQKYLGTYVIVVEAEDTEQRG